MDSVHVCVVFVCRHPTCCGYHSTFFETCGRFSRGRTGERSITPPPPPGPSFGAHSSHDAGLDLYRWRDSAVSFPR